MRYNIRIVSTYPPRRCGIGTFARDLASALEHFTGEVGTIRVAAIGSGRVTVATKSRYALELIHSNRSCPGGLVVGRHARGMLVDPGEPSVEQIAEALDRIVFNQKQRLTMEKQAHQRGYQMRWHNTAWALIQHIEFVDEEKEIITSRGPKFAREKASVFQTKKPSA